MALQAKLGVLVAVAVSFGGVGCSSAPSASAGDGGAPCETIGDGRCYQTCTTSADCSSGYYCKSIGLYAGGIDHDAEQAQWRRDFEASQA